MVARVTGDGSHGNWCHVTSLVLYLKNGIFEHQGNEAVWHECLLEAEYLSMETTA
jgi:hypothetical protein